METPNDAVNRVGRIIGYIASACIFIAALYYVSAYTSNKNKPVKIDVMVDSVLYEQQTIGMSQLTKIGNGLYYDSATNIVYWWNGSDETMPTAYYLANGQMCKYDPENNSITEVN